MKSAKTCLNTVFIDGTGQPFKTAKKKKSTKCLPKTFQKIQFSLSYEDCLICLKKKISPIYTVLDVQLKKAMAPHSSTLAWKIPRAGEPGRLQSMGSLRVGHY